MLRFVRPARMALCAASLGACAPLIAAPSAHGDLGTNVRARIDVLHQSVEVAPFQADEGLRGVQTLSFRTTEAGDRLRFEGGPLKVISVELDGRPVTDWEMADGTLEINLPRVVRRGSAHILGVNYEARPGRGLRRSDELVYTTYFSCDWMLCDQENFDDRFTFELVIRAPRGMTSLGPGEPVGIEALAADELHRWRTREPFPAYTHAFAVGRLERFEPSDGCNARLDVLSTAPADQVAAIFQPTCDMMRFFEHRSGVAYPAARYSQLHVTGRTEAQEAISHSVLGGGAVEPMIGDPREDWAVAHELAHQWWGNRVTARTLPEFWLNEGVVTFMVAAWKEHRWGQEAYVREIGLARGRWNRCREEWQDAPLAFAGTYPSVAVRRCIQYSKAAVFLHELRLVMGDTAFWSGLRAYTTANLGRSVVSRDFEQAMQTASPTDLGPLFAEWVYPARPTPGS